MGTFTINNVKLVGLASCVPKQIEKNLSLEIFNGDEAEKFCSATGVYQRRVADDETTTADLCYNAAERLIKDLGWNKDSIDCLIFVSQTPDYILPATSCILQHKLALNTGTFALDISLGCSGWVYGLSTIGQLMNGSKFKRGILLAGDVPLKFNSRQDKSTWPLFGDCGTATAFEYCEEASPIYVDINTDGSGYDAIIIPDGGCRNQFNSSSLKFEKIEDGIIRNRLHTILNGMDVFSFGISKAPQSVNQLIKTFNLNIDEIDYFIFHQANLFMNEKIRKKLNICPKKVPYSLSEFGNTSSATIPLTLSSQISSELKNSKLKIIACGFGVGLSWGSIYFESNSITVSELVEI